MGNFFSGIKNIFTGPTKLSWLQVLGYGILPLGQLFARNFQFKGSLDKWWLMFPIFFLPPFSFIAMILMKFGFVKDGAGYNGFDIWMMLPMIAKLVIPFILPFMIDEDSETLFAIVSVVLQLIAGMAANLIRRYNNCKNISLNSIGKAGMDTTIATAVGDVTTFAIDWIPIIGIVSTIIKMIPVIGDFADTIIWSVGFGGAYVIINMINQSPDLARFCSAPFTGFTADKIPFILSIIVMIVITVFNSTIPI